MVLLVMKITIVIIKIVMIIMIMSIISPSISRVLMMINEYFKYRQSDDKAKI